MSKENKYICKNCDGICIRIGTTKPNRCPAPNWGEAKFEKVENTVISIKKTVIEEDEY